METYVSVLPLRRVAPEAGASVGAKALNLAALMRARLPVPEGFVVTAEAYLAHVSTLELGPLQRALSDRSRRGQRLAAIREIITSGKLARDTAAGI
ncbi:hypothetical protein JXD38_11060, partial [candidate division WOR-3 bacterium]|nr:hypothetical protein [candidate division WOR-3 bacterium]